MTKHYLEHKFFLSRKAAFLLKKGSRTISEFGVSMFRQTDRTTFVCLGKAGARLTPFAKFTVTANRVLSANHKNGNNWTYTNVTWYMPCLKPISYCIGTKMERKSRQSLPRWVRQLVNEKLRLMGRKTIGMRAKISNVHRAYYESLSPTCKGLTIQPGLPTFLYLPLKYSRLTEGVARVFGSKKLTAAYVNALQSTMWSKETEHLLSMYVYRQLGLKVEQARQAAPIDSGSSWTDSRMFRKIRKIGILPEDIIRNPQALMHCADSLMMKKSIGEQLSSLSTEAQKLLGPIPEYSGNIRQWHDQLASCYRKLGRLANEAENLKPFQLESENKWLSAFPILHGNVSIVLPKSPLQLLEWGEQMHHCIYSYRHSHGRDRLLMGVYIDNRLCYNLAVVIPTPTGKDLDILELRGKNNQDPTIEHSKLILQALESAGWNAQDIHYSWLHIPHQQANHLFEQAV